MRSQTEVAKNYVGYLQELKDSSVSIVASIRVLKKQVGGSSFVRFTLRDVYNSLCLVKSKDFDGGDMNGPIQMFMWRKENENDFYFDLEVDCNFSYFLLEEWWNEK